MSEAPEWTSELISEFKELKVDFTKVTTKVTDLSGQVSQNCAKLTALDEKVGGLTGEIKSIKENTAGLTGEIKSIKEEIKCIKENTDILPQMYEIVQANGNNHQVLAAAVEKMELKLQ